MAERDANRLARETSPYLLQHAHNPVDWYPWGEEAIATARRLDRPLFLSVGYSSCHWCHVMERESFENPAIAAVMNELFVNVKVDREERPDLDEIYMQAVQLFTGGHGGWPMSVFLTPDLEPYLGGTYYPPEDRHGMPGFPTVLRFAADIYRQRRADVRQTTEQVVTALRDLAAVEPDPALPGVEVLSTAQAAFRRAFDRESGGFGRAPKFPHAMGLGFLLRWHARSGDDDTMHMVRHTLRRMARGGIHDQLAGGFHRYATDAHWLVPHFEKMLYDNALLARAYVEGWQATGDAEMRAVAAGIFEYIDAEMTTPEGAFAAAQDADTAGVEGQTFVWQPAEIDAILGAETGAIVRRYYDVTDAGNFEHATTILSVPREPAEIASELGLDVAALDRIVREARPRLLAARRERPQPERDDKVIVAWNALMISALARAHRAWGDPELLDRATRAATFVLERAGADGALFRTARDGVTRGRGFLDDHAGFLVALLDLYEASFEPRWMDRARALEALVHEEFWDETEGAYFFTGTKHEPLLARPRQAFDNAVPAGNSLMAGALARLAAWTGEERYAARTRRVLGAFASSLRGAPTGMAEMLSALDFTLGPVVQVAIAGTGDAARALAASAARVFAPRSVVAGWPAAGAPAGIALLEDRQPVESRPAAYLCRDFTCRLPETDPKALETALRDAFRPTGPPLP